MGYEKLIKVQQALKAPKNQRNSFGGYSYRSCDDILEAVKPLLAEQNLVLTLTDEVRVVENRFYVVATASIFEPKDDTFVSIAQVRGWAREPEAKKGMDDSQITGSSSSYARKYALNGLFLIDDNKDADTDEYAKSSTYSSNKKTQPVRSSKKLEQPKESNKQVVVIDTVTESLQRNFKALCVDAEQKQKVLAYASDWSSKHGYDKFDKETLQATIHEFTKKESK